MSFRNYLFRLPVAVTLSAVSLLFIGCGTAPKMAPDRRVINDDVQYAFFLDRLILQSPFERVMSVKNCMTHGSPKFARGWLPLAFSWTGS